MVGASGHDSRGGVFERDCEKLTGILLKKRYALLIMMSLSRLNSASTSELIQEVNGHPSTVIGALRVLERMGLISRKESPRGHHRVLARLTELGISLINTPIREWM